MRSSWLAVATNSWRDACSSTSRSRICSSARATTVTSSWPVTRTAWSQALGAERRGVGL